MSNPNHDAPTQGYGGASAPTSSHVNRDLNAAELIGTHNRLTVSPDVIRAIATELGYADQPAFDGVGPSSLAHFFDVSDVLELLVRAKLRDLRVINTPAQAEEAETANSILQRIVARDYLTRAEVHDKLPAETVILLKMGPTRLWGYAVRQRLPRRAEEAIPSSFHHDVTGPFTDAKEAWLGANVIDASNVEELRTIVDDVPVEEDRYQRLRLGMALSDSFDQVWSSARGHWRLSPATRYIIPSRYGWCPYVFRVAEGGWRRDEFEGSNDRFMATRGYYIDYENKRLIELGEPDPNNAWRPKYKVSKEAPTDRDMEVAEVLAGSLIALGPAQRNPVIRLRQRGRRLF